MSTETGVVTPDTTTTPAAVTAATSETVVAPGNVQAPAAVQPSGVVLSPPPAAKTGENADIWSTLSPENKAEVEKKGWKTHDDIVKSALEAERKLSSTRPAEAPKDISEYDSVLVKPENAEAIGYNDEFETWFKQTSFSGKVDPATAKHYHTEFVKWAGEQAASVGASIDTRITETETALTKAWGTTNNPSFARNLEMSQRAIANLDPGLKDALVARGVITTNAKGEEVAADAIIIQALAKAGAAMYAEDTLFGNRTDTTTNPFDPDTLNIGKQSEIVRRDKNAAKSLIQALKPEHQARYANLMASLA